FLKSQLSRVQEQFSQLSASQKMLAATLVIITVMTLFWWTTFAGKAEMEVLFDQPMAADQMASAIAQLQAAGIESLAVGDRLHVAADKKLQAIGLLSSSMLLPGDTKNAIDDVISKYNPFMPHSLEDRMFLHAKQTVLAQTLRYWPQIRHAVVIIDPTRDRGPNGTEPSASVSIMLKPGAVADQRLADSIGDFISGALSSLHRSRVKVHINDRSFTLRDKDDRSPSASAEDLLAQVQSYETHYANKIKKQFEYIDGVFVTVTCRVNNERTEKVVETIDPKSVISKPVSEKSFTEENNSNSRGGGEPGVVSNQALSVDNAGGGDKTTGTSEKTETEYTVAIPKSR